MAATETDDIEIQIDQEQVPEAEPTQEQQPAPVTEPAPAEPEPASMAIPGSAPPEPATLPAQPDTQSSQAAFQTLPPLQYVHPTYQVSSLYLLLPTKGDWSVIQLGNRCSNLTYAFALPSLWQPGKNVDLYRGPVSQLSCKEQS